MDREVAITRINEQGWKFDTIGKDKALVFKEGKVIEGTWKKTDRTSRTLFYDDKDKEISFIPGVFWIEVVPPDVYENIKVIGQ